MCFALIFRTFASAKHIEEATIEGTKIPSIKLGPMKVRIFGVKRNGTASKLWLFCTEVVYEICECASLCCFWY